MKHIAIFASGSGTNAEAIMQYFEQTGKAKVAIILSNKEDAYVLTRAKNHSVPTHTFTPRSLRENPDAVIEVLESHHTDLIVLAGFMLLVPDAIVRKYDGRIVNIHPALLPAYGGKGMYGDNVHRSVVAAGEIESGITIHHVSSRYDEGAIIFQTKTKLAPTETPESLAEKIHSLEHEHFPRVIGEVIENLEQR